MAFVATTQVLRGVRRHSIGPMNVEYGTWAAASGDVSGTVTSSALASIDKVIVTGLVLTAATTYSGNVATITFTNPLATVNGEYVIYGR